MKQNEKYFFKTLILGVLFLSPFLALAQPIASNDNATGNEDQPISITAIQGNDLANTGSLVLSSIDLNWLVYVNYLVLNSIDDLRSLRHYKLRV